MYKKENQLLKAQAEYPQIWILQTKGS